MVPDTACFSNLFSNFFNIETLWPVEGVTLDSVTRHIADTIKEPAKIMTILWLCRCRVKITYI